ncbi:MAG: N-acetylmuramoyl-L-alanine amidase, partial [Thiohalomonadales bacterium]
ENTHSDYRYTDFKHMIQHISDTMKFQESKSLAAHVQHSLYNNVNRLNNNTADHGIKPGPFVVLLGLEAPSILTEVANLSNIAEEKRLKSNSYRDKIAKFLEKGIVNYLNNNTAYAELR